VSIRGYFEIGIAGNTHRYKEFCYFQPYFFIRVEGLIPRGSAMAVVDWICLCGFKPKVRCGLWLNFFSGRIAFFSSLVYDTVS
jgi:hypothetical protein